MLNVARKVTLDKTVYKLVFFTKNILQYEMNQEHELTSGHSKGFLEIVVPKNQAKPLTILKKFSSNNIAGWSLAKWVFSWTF